MISGGNRSAASTMQLLFLFEVLIAVSFIGLFFSGGKYGFSEL
jgi:hypothetical protein